MIWSRKKREDISISSIQFATLPTYIVTYILVLEARQNLNLAQCSLAIGLVLERRDLLDRHLRVRQIVHGRAGGSRMCTTREREKSKVDYWNCTFTSLEQLISLLVELKLRGEEK